MGNIRYSYNLRNKVIVIILINLVAFLFFAIKNIVYSGKSGC
jgi:hypothetical protein